MEDSQGKRAISGIKGTKDILPNEVGEWQRVEEKCRSIFELYGYRELRAPILEATELFERSTGQTSDVVTKEMYTFTDKAGRSITLRPEYTPSVVRSIIENRLFLQAEPMRYYYIGPMFRYDKPQKGRYRQFHQADIEVFGEKDPAIDAEIIEMAHRLLSEFEVADPVTMVNSVGCQNCRPGYLKELRNQVERVREALCADCQRKAVANPLRIFDCKVEACQKLSESFPRIIDFLCAQCEDHFKRFRSYLDFYNIPYRIEPRLVRGLDYYTKTTFEIISGDLGAQNAILGGGRYDDMMKQFGGPDICGIGFAMGMERLLSVVNPRTQKREFIYFVYLGHEAKKAAIGLAGHFRKNGLECLLEFRDKGLKNQLSRANKLEASWVLIVGDEEMAKGRYQLKNMKTAEQREGDREELLKILLENQSR
jgi:histidyl-tRNA synthetase